MKTAIAALAGVHMLLAAVMVGSALVTRYGGRELYTPLVWSARIQLLLGLVLVGLNEAADESLNNTKIAVKLLVAIGVVACAEIANARHKRGEPKLQLVDAAGALTVLNVFVAFLWR
jgi:hypothetical protein